MADQSKKHALSAEISAAAAAAQPAAAQLDMLMPPTRSSITDDEQARVEKSVKRDRAGRPPGAQNKATREMLEFVRRVCGDPMERRFRWAMHTPESLSIELGCTKLEAFDRLERMWADLSRYFYAQQAAVDGQGNAVTPRLTMILGPQHAGIEGAPGTIRPPWHYEGGPVVEVEQNQSLSASVPSASHDTASDQDGKRNDISGLDQPGR